MSKKVPESNALTHTTPQEPMAGAELKPPTQCVAVDGFDGFRPMGASGAETIPQPTAEDWRFLATLPPFQMFVQEQKRSPAEADQQRWAFDYAVQHPDQRTLMVKYFDWHTAKGCWPNETPAGLPKE